MLEVIILSFIIAYFRGGHLKDIPKFNKVYTLAISIILQITAALFVGWSNWLISIAYLFLLFFFFSNRNHEDFRIFMIGWLLNASAIWLNGGKMPVDLNQLAKTPWLSQLMDGQDFKHVLIDPSTRLAFLGDILYIPFPIPRVISIGDIFLVIAAFLLVQRIMNKQISLIAIKQGG